MSAVPKEQLPNAGVPSPDSPISKWAQSPSAQLGMLGAESQLTEEESTIVDVLHSFAEKEMRPLGQLLDRMTPEEVIAPKSPLWGFYEKFNELGFTVSRPDRSIEGVIMIEALEIDIGWTGHPQTVGYLLPAL